MAEPELTNLQKTNNEIIEKANDNLLDVKEEENQEEPEKNTEKVEETKPTEDEIAYNKDNKADVPDVVKSAQELNAELKKQLEDLQTRNSNVFEENKDLKKQIEEQEALEKVAVENAAMKAQIEELTKNTMIDSLLASGKITKDLRVWAEGLPFEQLKEFSDKAPKMKTILDEKNTDFQLDDENMAEWKAEQMKSRIL